MKKGQYCTKKFFSAFSAVEVILAVGVFSVLVLGLGSGLAYSVQSNKNVSFANKANSLVDEGLEATRTIRNQAFSNLVDGTYGITISANKWVFSGSNDITESLYTRTIQISTIDAYSKLITATVSWPQSIGGTHNLSKSMYLTDWKRVVSVGWSPPVLGTTLDLTGNDDVIKIVSVGDYLYTLRGTNNTFAIVNATNPLSLVAAGTLTLTGNINGLSVSGNYAYVTGTGNSSELQVVDITNPSSPTLATTLDLTGNANAYDVFIAGNYAYIARDNAGSAPQFTILDISNPLSITTAGTLSFSGGLQVSSIYVSGNYAYLATSGNSQELTVVDISVPATPVQVGTLDLGTNDDGILIKGKGSAVFVAKGDNLVYIVNVSTPSAPSLLSTFNAGGTVGGIDFNTGNYMFLATTNSTREFQVVDISNLSIPVLYNFYDTTASLLCLSYDSAKNYAFTGSSGNSQEILVFGP